MRCCGESHQHLTNSRIAGPTKVELPQVVVPWLDKHIQRLSLKAGDYVFFGRKHGPRKPLPSAQWTALVKRIFRTHAGVPLAPKEVRSSYVTWLRNGSHGDEVLAATARAMKHSSKTQASVAYDKGSSSRNTKAAVAVATKFAAAF